MQTTYTTLIRAIKGSNNLPAILAFMKASQIVEEKKLEVVLRLRGFHFLKSFFGYIWYIMEGSGLAEAMGVVYGPNTVKYIMKGAVYTKALRAHFLTDGTLVKHIIRASDIPALRKH